MSDTMKAVNPFIDRIPRELQEQYMTDLVTEYIKVIMGEPSNNDEGGISLKYGLVVAFARKTWKLQSSIGRYVQIRPISEGRLAINTAKHSLHTPQTKLSKICVCGKIKTTCIHQTMYWIIRAYLYVYIVASNYYYHKTTNWYRGGLLVYGRQSMCRGLHFLWKNTLYIKDRVIYTSEY